jgi:DnaK suppressor protein
MTGNERASVERFEAMLKKELRELDEVLAETAKDTAPVELDQQSVGRLSRMDAMQVQAMALETRRRREDRRIRIRQALQRIEDGKFGDCLKCGEPIAERRLEADPTYRLCINCV